MDRESREVRAASFGAVAEVYERARPGYPGEAVRWLAGDGPLDVVDLGAGTGKLTRSLVSSGHRVVAIDPSDEMLARLREALPDAEPLVGSAESIPLPAGSADVVAAAQAYHWFDAGRALPEIARVLRPGGRLALVWNTRDASAPLVERLGEIIGSEHLSGGEVAREIDASRLFERVEHETFAWEQALDRELLLALVASRSLYATRTAEDQRAMLAAVGRVFDEEQRAGVVVLPYVTEAFRARRR